MPNEDRPRNRGGVEEYSFDELAKGVASGTVSRGRALRLAGGALLAAVFGWGVAAGEAEAAPRCPDSGPGCNSQCTGTQEDCACVRTTEGRRLCVHTCCRKTCNSSADCPSGQICSTTARKCCGRRKPVCVVPCNRPNPCGMAGAAHDGGWSNAA